MDGNRGAKGSIKDRLISMLYRLRYAKKVKKEDEYKIAKKEKQVEYLKKLVELQENENIDILDTTDKKELDKVKFTATYKLSNNSFNLNKKGICQLELEKESKYHVTGLEEIDFNLTKEEIELVQKLN